MNSCLYECEVSHERLEIRKYLFKVKFFWLYLDLDELDEIEARFKIFSRNRFNLYSFFDSDHCPGSEKTAKENIIKNLRSKGVDFAPGKVFLLTQPRVLGYVFNPVSFYYFFDEKGFARALSVEVGNTFGEQKTFVFGPEKISHDIFRDRRPKHYYISPFIDLEAELDFSVRVPGENLSIAVDDWKENRKIFAASVKGRRLELSGRRLFWYAWRYALQPQRIIALIHLHALILWVKKVTFFKKEDRPELQKEVMREYRKK